MNVMPLKVSTVSFLICYINFGALILKYFIFPVLLPNPFTCSFIFLRPSSLPLPFKLRHYRRMTKNTNRPSQYIMPFSMRFANSVSARNESRFVSCVQIDSDEVNGAFERPKRCSHYASVESKLTVLTT